MPKSPPDWATGGPLGWGATGDTCKGVEVRLNDDGTIDEICAKGFHLEQMDDGQYWIGLRVGKDTQHIMLTRHGKRIFPTVYK